MERKKIFSWILAIGMVIMMLPLNAFAANSANTTDFEYSTPDDITIYKNETKEVEISSYVYGNHKSYDLDSISVSSDNANIEVTQPSKGRMKVKGLKEGISAVIIKYSWLYNGKKQTGTSSFKVTVKDFQYCWELEGQGYYNDNDSNDLYIGESKEWNVNLRKIYYKDNGKKYQQRIKNFDIITKTYRKVENEDEDGDEWYTEVIDNSLLSIDIDHTDNSIKVTGKKEAECYLDIQVRYQGQNIKVGDGDYWEDEDKVTRKFDTKKESYKILENSSAYRPMQEGDIYTEFHRLLVNQKINVRFQLIHIYYDEQNEERKTENLSNAVIKAYYSQKEESGEFQNVELNSKPKLSRYAEMSFENNTLTIKGTNADPEVDEDGDYYDCEEWIGLDAYINGKKVESSGASFEIRKNLENEAGFNGIDNDNSEYDEEYVQLKKNKSKTKNIGYFSIEGYSWDWDKDEPYKADSIEVVSSDASIATATVPKMDEDGDYYCTFEGKKSGTAIITFKYTYTFAGSSYTGKQKVEVIVGYNPYTSYQLNFVKEGSGEYTENEENSSDDHDFLKMSNPYNATLKAKVYKVCGDEDGNTTKTEVNNFTLKCEEYEGTDEDYDEYEKKGTIKTSIDNSNQSIQFIGEANAYCVYKISFDLNDKTENQYNKQERYVSVSGMADDDVYYTVGMAENSDNQVVMLKEGETFPINVYRYDSEHPNGINVNDSIVKMKSSGKCLEINNNSKTIIAKQAARTQLTILMNEDECDYIELDFCIIPKSGKELSLEKEEQLKEDGDTFVFVPQKTGQYKLLEIFKNALYENSMAGIEVLDSSGRKVLESDSYYSSPIYKKAASCVFDLEKGKTYYFSYDTCYSYKGYTGSRWDLFRTSPEKIRLSYIEDDDQDSSHAHNYIATITKQATCTTDGIRTYKCSCGDSYQETIKATGHLHKETRNKKEATETEAGYTGDIYCKDCNTMLEKGSIIPATGQKQPSDIDSTNTPAKPSQPSKDKNNTSSTQTPKQENSLKQGAKVTDNKSKAVYKVNGNKTVEYNKVDKKAKTAIIPTTVKVNGVNYQVTAIAAKAFANNKSLKKVVIPASVRSIGKQAFSGCKNLKTITIKTPYLTKKSVGAKAFKGIYAKATIKVPKKQKKVYQKLLKSKGVGKKAKIK